MPATVVVGTQWGDEGKGRVVDLRAKESVLVVRYQGGHNAGHTIVVDGETFALQLVPSGVLYDHVTPVIGNGVVVDPVVLLAEVDMLERKGVDCSRLVVSTHAHLVMPYHQAMDTANEERLGEDGIGTTRRGIGPAYADKASRIGIRVEDLLDPPTFRRRLRAALLDKNELLRRVHDHPGFDADELAEHYLEDVAPRIAGFAADTVSLIHESLEAGHRVLFEGAQATFLDLDHGTYPFVTSSNPVAGAATVGAGIGPGVIDRVVGVVKAYTTRVGAGPFVTELDDETGDLLVERGHEFGTNTGRRRRTGWLDLVMLRHAVRLNGCTELVVTKLDVLDTLDRIRVCTAYEIDGVERPNLPDRMVDLEKARPVYRELRGWEADTSNAREVHDLPPAVRDYLDFVSEWVGVPVSMVCVGPGREQYVHLPE